MHVLRAIDPTGEPPHDRLDPATIEAPAQDRLAPVRDTPLPITGPHPPLLAVLGAHGGAGASTLARWWAHAADTGLAWPGSPRSTQLVVLAARDCIPGLTAAADRLREWHASLTPDGVTIVALVLVAARPGRVPAPVRRFRRTVTELLDEDAVFSIAWHEELIVRELTDLARYTPADPPPPRRAHLTAAVPPDVHRAGAAITARIAASRVTTPTTGRNR
ncbi:hypothetical protein K7711_36595 [Nocardia sp. CA2R105]|uniref:hypothetical protein n=1 Tax=Nocardia coffeae TaxID=2873381 RepID=UPI001CA66129|nr:hypothetical protein [Nocardia coffeae]MBY8862044.1 hypothetical protein [Nocardia coffeae]